VKKILFAIAAVCIALASITLAIAVRVDKAQKQIVGITPQDVRWFTPPYYMDGRQRAQMLGDSNQGGAWIDRVKIPAGGRVLAHTHPHDEIVTVIEGTWYLGEGEKFDLTKLKAYPAGSFIVIPGGVPHFVAAKDGTVIVQLSATGKFGTEYLEK
jgi:quercetin dioxygenase-like cupin family protein